MVSSVNSSSTSVVDSVVVSVVSSDDVLVVIGSVVVIVEGFVVDVDVVIVEVVEDSVDTSGFLEDIIAFVVAKVVVKRPVVVDSLLDVVINLVDLLEVVGNVMSANDIVFKVVDGFVEVLVGNLERVVEKDWVVVTGIFDDFVVLVVVGNLKTAGVDISLFVVAWVDCEPYFKAGFFVVENKEESDYRNVKQNKWMRYIE